MRGRLLVVVLSALLVLAGCGSTGLEKKPSTTLPAVSLKPLEAGGDGVDLSTLKGPVVLNLWANWCGPCRKDMPIYQDFHAAHPGVRMLGVDTMDTQPDKAMELLSDSGTTYPQVADPDGRLLDGKYLPKLVLVDSSGEIAYQQAIQIKSVAQLEKLVDKHLGASL